MPDLPLCPRCPAWGGARVGSESHRYLTGPEGWGWAGNMLQAHGLQGLDLGQSVGGHCGLRVRSVYSLPWGPGEGNHVEVGTPL